MYTVKENVTKEAIENFLQSRQLTLDVPYQFSLGLFENSRLQGVLLYEDSLWESQMLQKKVMNVKLLAANSAGQLKRLFEAFYSVRQMDETDFIFVRVPAEDIGAAHVIQQQPSSYFVGSLLKLAKPRLFMTKQRRFLNWSPLSLETQKRYVSWPETRLQKADIFKILISAVKQQTKFFRSGHETI